MKQKKKRRMKEQELSMCVNRSIMHAPEQTIDPTLTLSPTAPLHSYACGHPAHHFTCSNIDSYALMLLSLTCKSLWIKHWQKWINVNAKEESSAFCTPNEWILVFKVSWEARAERIMWKVHRLGNRTIFDKSLWRGISSKWNQARMKRRRLLWIRGNLKGSCLWQRRWDS